MPDDEAHEPLADPYVIQVGRSVMASVWVADVVVSHICPGGAALKYEEKTLRFRVILKKPATWWSRLLGDQLFDPDAFELREARRRLLRTLAAAPGSDRPRDEGVTKLPCV